MSPPDVTGWVPDDHVVWSILGAVDRMDLSAFYGAYRDNGQGRAAGPSVDGGCAAFVRVRAREPVLAGDRVGVPEDVVYKPTTTALAMPDHSTIAEFRCRHGAGAGRSVLRGVGVGVMRRAWSRLG